MTQTLKSLDEISTGYSIFEKDQVLTASQLNSVASYFEDQTRLSRTQLLGVGLVCGLQVTAQEKQVLLTKGMGVTTDGDLLYFGSDMAYDSYKVYDEKNPVYPQFYIKDKMIPLYELIPVGVNDKRAFPLNQLIENTGWKMESMVALLYMESFVFDPDLCAGTDCNNVGQKMTNNTRVLLLGREYLGMLKPNIPTPKVAYAALEELVADRPKINDTIKTHAQLVLEYRSTCNTIYKCLVNQLTNIYPNCSFFLSGLITGDPFKSWQSTLDNWNTYYTKNETGIQYYYDFLRDITDTYNEFHELLFNDTSWCSPDKDAFPKHLILGSLTGDPENDADRTGLYPSHLVSHTIEQKEHAKFLVQKLNTLIATFQAPVLNDQFVIRITPSSSEESSLEVRAIPYFYQIDKKLPMINESWNFKLHQKRKDASIYSYNAVNYGAKGAAADPTQYQIGRFDFFRVEGHLGLDIARVHAYLENEISTKNLPINLRSVMLGEDKRKIVIKPGFVFTDLHKLHNMMRQDVLNQLEEVKKFSGGLKTRVHTNIDLLDTVDKGTFEEVANSRDSELMTSINLASAKLSGSYQQYTAQNTESDSWRKHLTTTMEQSGKFKGQLTLASKTEFNTPFDTLISNRHIDMLNHLDILIKGETEKKQNKLLFNNYIAEHPGLEHAAGVMRGGTFVLVYDENSKIIADFMLPYQETDAEKNDLLEPEVVINPFRNDFIIGQGLNIIPPIDIKIKNHIDDFKLKDLDGLINVKTDGIRTALDGTWNAKFNAQQSDYFNTIKQSFGTMSDALVKKATTTTPTGSLSEIKDAGLNKTAAGLKSRRDLIEIYTAQANEATDNAEKSRYNDMAAKLQEDLSDSIGKATEQIANSGAEVVVGSDAFNFMMEVNSSLGAIKETAVLSKTRKSIGALAEKTTNSSVKFIIDAISKV